MADIIYIDNPTDLFKLLNDKKDEYLTIDYNGYIIRKDYITDHNNNRVLKSLINIDNIEKLLNKKESYYDIVKILKKIDDNTSINTNIAGKTEKSDVGDINKAITIITPTIENIPDTNREYNLDIHNENIVSVSFEYDEDENIISLISRGKETYDLSKLIDQVKKEGKIKENHFITYFKYIDGQKQHTVEIDGSTDIVSIYSLRPGNKDNDNVYKFAHNKNVTRMIDHTKKIEKEYQKRNLPLDRIRINSSSDDNDRFIIDAQIVYGDEDNYKKIFSIDYNMIGDGLGIELYEYDNINPFEYVVLDKDNITKDYDLNEFYVDGYSNDESFIFKLIDEYKSVLSQDIGLFIKYSKHGNSDGNVLLDLTESSIFVGNINNESPILYKQNYFDDIIDKTLGAWENVLEYNNKLPLILSASDSSTNKLIGKFEFDDNENVFKITKIHDANRFGKIMLKNNMKYFDNKMIVSAIMNDIC